MTMRPVGALWFALLIFLAPVARAQTPASAATLAMLRATPDSNAPTPRSWSGTGAIVGGLGGGAAFAVAFYHFTHRNGAVNNKSSIVGGTLVGVALGAASGALLGAFVGSLFPKH